MLQADCTLLESNLPSRPVTDDARTSQKNWGEIRPPEEKTTLGINNRPARIGNQPVNHLAADQANNIWALAPSFPDDAH